MLRINIYLLHEKQSGQKQTPYSVSSCLEEIPLCLEALRALQIQHPEKLDEPWNLPLEGPSLCGGSLETKHPGLSKEPLLSFCLAMLCYSFPSELSRQLLGLQNVQSNIPLNHHSDPSSCVSLQPPHRQRTPRESCLLSQYVPIHQQKLPSL
eukprot:Gb_30621 [translate_table: standard]